MRFSFKTWLFENQRLNQDDMLAYKDPLNLEFNYRIKQFAQRIILGLEDKEGEDPTDRNVRARPDEQKKSVKDMSIGGKLTGEERHREHPEFKGWNPKLPEEIEIRGESIPITPETVEDECRKYIRENKFDTTNDFDFFGIIEKKIGAQGANDALPVDILWQMITGYYASRSGSKGRVMTHIYKDGGWLNKDIETRSKILASNQGKKENRSPAEGKNSSLFNYFNSGWLDVAMLGVIMCRNRNTYEPRVASIWGERLGILVPNAKDALIVKDKKERLAKERIGDSDVGQKEKTTNYLDDNLNEINGLETLHPEIISILDNAPEEIKAIVKKKLDARLLRDFEILFKFIGNIVSDSDSVTLYYGSIEERIEKMKEYISSHQSSDILTPDKKRIAKAEMLEEIKDGMNNALKSFNYAKLISGYEGLFKKFDANPQSLLKGKRLTEPKKLFVKMFETAMGGLFTENHASYIGNGAFLNLWLTNTFRNIFYAEHENTQPPPASKKLIPGYPNEDYFRGTLVETLIGSSKKLGILDNVALRLDNNVPGKFTELANEIKGVQSNVVNKKMQLGRSHPWFEIRRTFAQKP